MRKVEVTSLMAGLLFAAIAFAAGWTALGGTISRQTLAVAAPLTLVVIGIVGLVFSRA